MLLDDLKDRIDPPSWLKHNCMYLTQMGSVAYGCSGESSDWDMYGFCVPPKDLVFPHLRGEIAGFGKQHKRFDQWQQHRVESEDGRITYDFAIYGIVRFFQLCMENNPNMVDALFVPDNMIVHITHVGNMVRDARKLFLHKGCWHKFKGYAFSQLHKAKTKGQSKELMAIRDFESRKGLPIATSFEDVKKELKKRGIDGCIDDSILCVEN